MKVRKIKQKIFIYSLLGNKKKLLSYRDRLEKYNMEQELRAQEAVVAKQEYENRKKLLDELATHRAGKKYDITCFVVTYNHEQSISKCLDSILSQETKYNYLIKVLDDCSTDGTTEVVMDYVKRYPDKIELCLQPTNTRGMHISAALRTIDTEYWCMIDGDDWWCNDGKIEIALGYMNVNTDTVMYVHDTVYKGRNSEFCVVHDNQNITEDRTFDINNIIHSHLSGRIYRNCIDFKKEYENVRKRDGILNEIYAATGPCFYNDCAMSVYDRTSGGVWTRMSAQQQRYSSVFRVYMTCKTLGHKYDRILLSRFGMKKAKRYLVLGKTLGWKLYLAHQRRRYMRDLIKQHKKELKRIERGHKYFPKSDMEKLRKLNGE